MLIFAFTLSSLASFRCCKVPRPLILLYKLRTTKLILPPSRPLHGASRCYGTCQQLSWFFCFHSSYHYSRRMFISSWCKSDQDKFLNLSYVNGCFNSPAKIFFKLIPSIHKYLCANEIIPRLLLTPQNIYRFIFTK